MTDTDTLINNMTKKALITGCEYGYEGCKKGWSLTETLELLMKMYEKENHKVIEGTNGNT